MIQIGHEYDVHIIVDAAGQTYPTERVKLFVRMGADLVIYSGKYFLAPNSTGFLCGRKDLVEAAMEQSYIGPSLGWIGRGYKLDQHEIVALVTTLQRWMKMDHKKRLQPTHEKRSYIMKGLEDIHDIELTVQSYHYHVVGLEITFNKKIEEETTQLA